MPISGVNTATIRRKMVSHLASAHHCLCGIFMKSLLTRGRIDRGILLQVLFQKLDVPSIRQGCIWVAGDEGIDVKALWEVTVIQLIPECGRFTEVACFIQWLRVLSTEQVCQSHEFDVLAFPIFGEPPKRLPVPPHFQVGHPEDICAIRQHCVG
jgi:hypothetical protein